MSGLKELERLLTQGKITRREFLARASALGLAFLALCVTLFVPNGASSVGIRTDWDMAVTALLPTLRDWAAASLLSAVLGPLVAALAAYRIG